MAPFTKKTGKSISQPNNHNEVIYTLPVTRLQTVLCKVLTTITDWKSIDGKLYAPKTRSGHNKLYSKDTGGYLINGQVFVTSSDSSATIADMVIYRPAPGYIAFDKAGSGDYPFSVAKSILLGYINLHYSGAVVLQSWMHKTDPLAMRETLVINIDERTVALSWNPLFGGTQKTFTEIEKIFGRHNCRKNPSHYD